ncbi:MULTISPECIES: carbon-nitrogen hydrolase family protein [unclassified Curtobacterium]|uniref:carbon-nitrogen hydrolase family protein n=1 Tax=unclassified Curtobacterium TaxID=257496 RepID=UPI001050FF84|nr:MULTISPECIES: carbon-nitrogen hydrolase family protein [unclassified Curtobacterium]TCL78046.1 putative amidohydrolase [Curtobacterium sp. PhB128]TCL94771.1 putative amidohydrolase [Curtobacterium sp. PhB138]
MGTLTIAAAQFAPVDDPVANLETVRTAAADAAARGAALLVTPEYSSYFTADIDDRFVAAAQPLDGPFVSGLQDIARDTGLALVVGIAETTDAETTDAERTDAETTEAATTDAATADEPTRFRNTLVAVLPTGELAATYRKVHLYDAFGSRESDRIESGDPEQLPVFEFAGLRIGLETCYDLRFPEVTRRLAAPEHGAADVVVLPAEWVRGPGKEHHWRTLLTARAIENTVWVVGVGQTPPIGIGASVVLDPSGVAVAAAGSAPGTLVATVDTAVTEAVRQVNPSLALRRYDVALRARPGGTARP